MTSYLDTARRVIRTEADALALLEQSLGAPFEAAVGVILAATGRVVVSGMGKSGHVGRKIAATLASTGTPAQFVHPAEASHGDLGMVTRGDVALVLSNSGETPEIADIVAHTRRFAIPLIGVAGREGSTLLRQSDVALLLPQAPEACGTGIVPTSSTTMTLALGDALAVALMEHRRFTPEHFRTFHPGGKLGARLARVADLMHAEMPLVPEDAPMAEAQLRRALQISLGDPMILIENPISATLLGIAFLALQGYEYYHAYVDLNLKLNSGIFGSTFFMLTGFHGMHVLVGTLMLLVITLRLMKGHFTPQRHFGFEGAAWYWHFVDVVWLFLFAFVYVVFG